MILPSENQINAKDKHKAHKRRKDGAQAQWRAIMNAAGGAGSLSISTMLAAPLLRRQHLSLACCNFVAIRIVAERRAYK
jgi:hypothetical protein